ncbi:hypothetical protein PG995_013039 [Apiospora arundinis]
MANLLNFPSFSLNLEEKFSGQIEIDSLITEARSIIKRARYPAAHDNSQALEVLDEAITLAKDLRQEDAVDEDEDDEDQQDAATRRRALDHSLAEANLLRGHILRAMGDIPAACEAYKEAISRSPDVFPPSNTYATLTSSSSPSSSRSSSKKNPSSLLSPYETLRPSTSSGPSTSFSQPAWNTTTRSSSVRHHHNHRPKRQTAAKQAWKAIVELSPPRGQDDLLSYPPAPSSPEGAFVRRKSAPSNDAAMSREDKRRAGVWDAGYHPVHVDSPGCPLSPSLDESHRAMVDQCLEQLQRETKLDVPIQNVWAQKKVSIVESSSNSDGDASDSSSASVASERSIQHKKKCGDLRTQAQEPRRRR